MQKYVKDFNFILLMFPIVAYENSGSKEKTEVEKVAHCCTLRLRRMITKPIYI